MYFEDSLSTDSIDSGQFKLSGKLSPLCIENFATFCRTQIKTNPKNRRLFTNKSKDRFSQSSQSPRLSQFNSEVIEEITQREIKAKRRFREIFVNDHESNSQDASVKLDTDSCFI